MPARGAKSAVAVAAAHRPISVRGRWIGLGCGHMAGAKLGIWLRSKSMSEITLRPARQLDARIWLLRGSRPSPNTDINTKA
jgi:hypothetical protein